MDTSPHVNIYGYPDEVDYGRSLPLDSTWHNVQTSVRTSEEWALPEHLREGPGALLYLSLGSLGSADVELMQRLVDILGETTHRVIVSKGPLAEQIRLHDNMCGEGHLPQPAILPQVDLVITHGGNNTTCEALHHGKPMVVLPIFWDQYDNAQRIHETGLGVRLATYECDAAELTGAVDRLLLDAPLQARLAAMAQRLQSRSGTVVAAGLIEQLALGSVVG
jgi:MGT family glycosyltransferase